MIDPQGRWEVLRERAEARLRTCLPHQGGDLERLESAMAYVLLGGGKRVRPVLVYAAGEALGAPLEHLDGPACAVECIHAYSLVHDDLPAMDDDDLRRGRPTCHRAYDEATAILAGDALQALAFQLLADDTHTPLPDAIRLAMTRTLAEAAGAAGMVGGQAIDLGAVGRTLDEARLTRMHRLKTGALIEASVVLGALAAGAGEDDLAHLRRYARAIGLAFQVQDDILDVTASTEEMGKTQGADAQVGKPTYVTLLGLDGARKAAGELRDEARESLAAIPGDTALLAWLADYIVRRRQ